MKTKSIRWFGRDVTLACDENCSKAWGICSRPRVNFSNTDCDDFAYLADNELDKAPADPGTQEGGYSKPANSQGMNKWCSRECERSVISEIGERINLPDFSQRLYNKRAIH